MSRVLIISAVFCLIPAVSAGPDVLPITGTHGVMRYDIQTGTITPQHEQTRGLGPYIWAAIEPTGYFYGHTTANASLDWGDVQNHVRLGGIGWSEYTNSQLSDGDNTMFIALYTNDNGQNTQPKQLIAGFQLPNIPGSNAPLDEYWGYTWYMIFPPPFYLITGDDLDGDTLTDFSYVHYFSTIRTPGAVMGPSISGTADPNVIPPGCPGIENAFDWYGVPDFENDPNMAATTYVGTYWFGGNPFAQFYWEMYAPGCPNAGAHLKFCTADCGNFNCIVDLGDLATLLGAYSIFWEFPPCDIYPPDDFFPGDGVVDMQDLAEMLGQYGDNCNWPQ